MKLNNKNKLLVAGFIVLMYAGYSLSVKKTIFYYSQYKTKSTIIENEISPASLDQLLKREKELDQIISSSALHASESFQNRLLKTLNGFASKSGIVVIDFRPPHSVEDRNVDITSYIFTVSGSFNSCLALISRIENLPNFGSIKHVGFKKIKDSKTNAESVYAEVVIQRTTDKLN